MLAPKNFKFPKMHRGRMRGKAQRGAEVQYGEYGLQALEPGWVSARQLEAARRAIVREARRRGKVWIRVFPDKPITKRAAETRMGKGKGNVEFYAAVIKPGRILFEVAGMPKDVAYTALTLAMHKLSVRSKIIGRTEFLSE
ncbi:MAG TPA: 50S ribosomal protein L16 [Anaerolineales bacterium]|jgi:large subunit ribosomal protein L16|uniref:Large ribosomal subunit protein uL16 n=1 Tax=uncultured Chloroflexi bacterium Rifle_16ft_4_minimus_1477 TaxID=1665058 RepID=A0A0H4T414_9CHLR|nr:50S ribosomal protein L16, large subunit ribosomal protein L16 [uncultured Chloroflexi bacterium Rifle_16ft_4_minimus_1477]HLD94428.1 50S ribosomal protein L16 [Anaerolineales bacterium]